MQQVAKQGALPKDRFQKLQSAYVDFTNSLIDEVFNGKTSLPENEETDEEN